MTNRKRYLIGFGNYAQGDDSIGLRVVEHIVDHALDKDFDAIEVGNDGLQLLTYFTDETAKIVIVDAALIDKEPGDFVIVDPEDVETKKIVDHVTTHEGDVLKLIELGKQLDYPIPPLEIIAIQPASLKLEMKLSDILQKNFARYVSACLERIRT